MWQKRLVTWVGVLCNPRQHTEDSSSKAGSHSAACTQTAAVVCHATALPSAVRVRVHMHMQKLMQLVSHGNAGLLHFVCICLDDVSFTLTSLKSAGCSKLGSVGDLGFLDSVCVTCHVLHSFQ